MNLASRNEVFQLSKYEKKVSMKKEISRCGLIRLVSEDGWKYLCVWRKSIYVSRKKEDMKQEYFKSALLGLKQLLAIESPLKMMKNASYFTSKAVSFSKIFRFFS